MTPLILKENPGNKISAPAVDVQKEAFRESAVEVDNAQRAKVGGLIKDLAQKLKAQGQPRYDKTLPLEQRITTWSLNRPSAEDRKDSDLYHQMMRAARNAAGDVLDLEGLRAQFCKWMNGKPPPEDAQAAWVGWLESTAPRRQQRPPLT